MVSQKFEENSNNVHRSMLEKSCFVIDGLVEEPLGITVNDLLQMDMLEEVDLLHACGSGEPKGRLKSCRGVLLTDIISMASVKISDHNDTKKMYIVVSSDDGYSTLFSWQELFNSSVGEGVMVILVRDGKKVYENDGSVDMFSARDFLTGPRYVKRLKYIKVLMIE